MLVFFRTKQGEVMVVPGEEYSIGVVQKPKPVPGGEPDDWVRKPFEVSQLVERLRRTLDRHRMLSAAVIRNSG